jgi:hypothetical protein
MRVKANISSNPPRGLEKNWLRFATESFGGFAQWRGCLKLLPLCNATGCCRQIPSRTSCTKPYCVHGKRRSGTRATQLRESTVKDSTTAHATATGLNYGRCNPTDSTAIKAAANECDVRGSSKPLNSNGQNSKSSGESKANDMAHSTNAE